MAAIHSLAYQPGPSSTDPPYRFNRVTAAALKLVAGYGIEGDYKAGRHPKRQVNILSLEMLHALEEEGWHFEPGHQFGEQIVVSGLDLESLPPGTRLQLGDSAVVEITMLRVPCSWLATVHNKNHEDVIGRVGVMSSVIETGEIAIGSPVKVLQVPGQQITE
jgi:MOSC domain-containing protein YiiM